MNHKQGLHNRLTAINVIDTIFHASGNPSFAIVRELLSLLPNALVISDVETTEILAITKTAQTLFGVDQQRWYEGASFYKNVEDWEYGLKTLQAQGGGPLRMVTTLHTTSGSKFTAICWVRITTMAGREVFITSIEPGEPQDVDSLPPPAFFTI